MELISLLLSKLGTFVLGFLQACMNFTLYYTLYCDDKRSYMWRVC